MDPNLQTKMVGIRPGEKLHEIMCPLDAYIRTLEFKDHYVIMPTIDFQHNIDFMENALGEQGSPVPENFEYNSGTNPHFMSIDELIELNKMVEIA